MKRVGFTMLLKAGNEAEYEKRHDEIWPELRRELAAAGVRDYTIFLDPETLVLFAFQRVTEPDTTAELPSKTIMKKWWDYMADLMEVNPDNSPVVRPLRELFHLD